VEEKRLPGLMINSYGAANFTLSLMLALATSYYAIFLTDVALISAVHVGHIMLITHLVDAFSIPIGGSIIQKTQMRWGQFRSWFLLMPLSTGVFFTLTFTNLPLPYFSKIVFLSMAYMIAHVSLNFAFNAHLGFISVLSDVKDRLMLSTRNIQFGMGSSIIFSAIIIPMLLFFSRQSSTWGYFYTVAILAVIQVIGYWNLFYQSKDYDKYDPNKKLNPSNNFPVKEMLTQVFGNKQLLIIMSADSMSNIAIFSLSTLHVYYFTYIVGNDAWMSPHTLALSLVAFSSSFLSPFIVKRIGKKRTVLLAFAWGTIGYFFLRAFGASSPYIYTGIFCVSGIIVGTAGPIRQAMYMDAAEYGYYKTGKDASAYIMSMFTIPIKIALAIAGTIAGYGLAYIGFEAGMEVTDQFINDLMNIICYIPASCSILGIILMSFYSLTDEKLAKYMEANKIKRAEAKVK